MFEKEKQELLKKLEEVNTISIIYHSDPDGICSSTIFYLYLNQNGIKTNLLSTKFGFCKIDEEIWEKALKSDLIAILDLSSIPESAKNFKERIVIIDHHLIKQELKEFFVINPRKIDESLYLPTSYIVWKMFENEVKNSEWIAYFGSKADKCRKCNDLYSKTIQKFPEVKKSELFNYLNLSRNLKSSLIINIALIETYKFGSPKYFRLTHAYHTLKSIKRNVEKEIANWILNKQKVFENQKIAVFRICSEYNIQGAISSSLLKNSKKDVIIVFNDCLEKEKVYFEFRAKLNAYKIFEKLMKKYSLDYGGHEKAFGCTLKENNLEKFLEEIKTISF